MASVRLSEQIADIILSMITVEKRFLPGDKLPNEIEFANELSVSRTTLREAIRVLVTQGVLTIDRGKGTFVSNDFKENNSMMKSLSNTRADLKDLYEMRLICEPEAAGYAAVRATDEELSHILSLGQQIEAKILHHENRTASERAFHKSIAKATHNTFMTKLIPVIYQAIDEGVERSVVKTKATEATLQDHRLIMEFLEARDPEGAKNAMKIHILHAIKDLEL